MSIDHTISNNTIEWGPNAGHGADRLRQMAEKAADRMAERSVEKAAVAPDSVAVALIKIAVPMLDKRDLQIIADVVIKEMGRRI